MICAVSSLYLALAPPEVSLRAAAKRGPRTALSDAEVVAAIRAVLAATPFHGEGYRKERARLAHRGLAVGGKRVLRLMRTHQLLAPRRLGPPKGDRTVPSGATIGQGGRYLDIPLWCPGNRVRYKLFLGSAY